ncbi:MFS transporter [soil metagenome]
MAREASQTAASEWRRNWPVVLAAAAGSALSAVVPYSTGIFIQPLEGEFGWSRASISAAMAIFATVGVFFSPVFGALLDRVGVRRMGLTGSLIFCAALASLSLAGPSIWSWWALWILVSFAALTIKSTIWSAAVSAVFRASRGLALGIVLCGTGIAASVVPMLTNMLIASVGWRGAYLGLGMIFAAVVTPLLFLFLHDAGGRRSRMAGQGGAADGRADLPGWTARTGFRRRQLYQLAAVGGFAAAIITAYTVHFVPILTGAGIDRAQAVQIVTLSGLMSMVARLASGLALDHLPARAVGGFSLILPILPALIFLCLPMTPALAIVAACLIGICAGAEHDVVIYLATRYFGMRNFWTLFGVVSSGILGGVGAGPFLAGYVYDRTGGYDLLHWAMIPAAILCSLLVATLGRYPDHDSAIPAGS